MSSANAMLARRLSETDFPFMHIMRHTNNSQEVNESFFWSLKAFANITYLWLMGTWVIHTIREASVQDRRAPLHG